MKNNILIVVIFIFGILTLVALACKEIQAAVIGAAVVVFSFGELFGFIKSDKDSKNND